MTNLDGTFTVLNDTAIIDKETGIEKFVIDTSEPVASGQIVQLTVDGKVRTAVVWIRPRKSYKDSFLPDVKQGTNMTWLHILPLAKKHTFNQKPVAVS